MLIRVHIGVLILGTLCLSASAFITALANILPMVAWLTLLMAPGLELAAFPAYALLALRGRGLFLVLFTICACALLAGLIFQSLNIGSDMLPTTREALGLINRGGLLLPQDTELHLSLPQQVTLLIKSIAYLSLALALLPRRPIERYLRGSLVAYSIFAICGLFLYRLGLIRYGLSLCLLWSGAAWLVLAVVAMPAFMEQADELMLELRGTRRD